MANSNHEDILQIEKLKDNENFTIWKFQVTIVFKSLGPCEIVTETLTLRDNTSEKEKAEWI